MRAQDRRRLCSADVYYCRQVLELRLKGDGKQAFLENAIALTKTLRWDGESGEMGQRRKDVDWIFFFFLKIRKATDGVEGS